MLLREAHRRLVRPPDAVLGSGVIPDLRRKLRAALFDKQLAFLDDPSKSKAALCSRRAGKTTETAPDLVDGTLETPGSKGLYVTLTRERAKDLLWPELQRLDHREQIGMKFNLVELTATMPEQLGGGVVKLAGADKAKEIQKRRGDKLKRARIDEAQAFGDYLREFVSDVLEPALLDLRGDIGLLGTPGPVCDGLFYEATTGKAPGWSSHHWTVLDNPFIPHAGEWLKAKRIERGWAEDNPTYRREWLGEWVNDFGALFYKYDEARNSYEELPKGHEWTHVLGVDLGFDDAFAMVVLAFSLRQKTVYEVASFSQSGLTPTEWGDRIEAWMGKYEPASIVVDTGGLGKAFVEEMRARRGLPLKSAEKKKKAAYVELLNDDLLTARLKVRRDSALAGEWRILPRDSDNPSEEHPGFANHCSDAALYAWREAKHWLGEERPEGPPAGSREALEAKAKRMEEELASRLEEQAREERQDEEDLWT